MAQTALNLPLQEAGTRTPRTQEADSAATLFNKIATNLADLVATDAANLAKLRDIYCVAMADCNTPGVAYVPISRPGTITRISVIIGANNATAATVFTAKIGAVSVTHPAISFALGALLGAVIGVVPSAANVVAAGDNLNITTDGGGSSVMPATIVIEVTPT